MPTEVPIACTLTEADLAQRLADARTLGAKSLVGVEADGRAAVLRFSGGRGPVDRFVEVESRCCRFFEFDVIDSSERIELLIAAPEGAEPALRSLVAAIVAGWEGGL